MNVYLDINGVVLTKDHAQAYFLKELLELLLSKHQVFWLTTHCQGESESTISYLSQYLDIEMLELTKRIKHTSWKTFKSEAIDFSQKFIWLDDYLMDSEKDVLRKHNVLESWIPIDLKENPKQLQSVYNALV